MTDYIVEPIETNPDSLLADAVDYIQGRYPNWEPSEAQLDFILMRLWSLKEAQIADMSTRVLRAIYRYFGSTIVSIQPLPGAYAEVLTTWYANSPDEEQTLTQDTQVGIRDPVTNDLVFFNVADQDYTVPVGSTFISGVKLRAQDEGEAMNGLAGPLEIVEQNDWVQEASTNGETGGGANPESDEDYIDRLTSNFTLLSPRPVLGPDWAVMARNIAGVARSNAIDNFIPGDNEIQTIYHNGDGGTLRLVFGAEESADIPWNANTDQIGEALADMVAFQAGDFVLSGGPFPMPVTVEYVGNKRTSDQPQLTINTTGLTGTAVTQTATTDQTFTADQLTVEDAVGVAATDSAGNTLSGEKRQELIDYLRSLRIQNFLVNLVDPTYTDVDVTATIVPFPSFDPNDVIGRASDALAQYLDPSLWGASNASETRGVDWENKTTIRIQELYTILNNVEGVDFVSALTFGLNGAAQDGTDKNITGIFPLTRPGAINLTI